LAAGDIPARSTKKQQQAEVEETVTEVESVTESPAETQQADYEDQVGHGD